MIHEQEKRMTEKQISEGVFEKDKSEMPNVFLRGLLHLSLYLMLALAVSVVVFIAADKAVNNLLRAMEKPPQQIDGVSGRVTKSLGSDLDQFGIIALKAEINTVDDDSSYTGHSRGLTVITDVKINDEIVTLTGKFGVDNSYFSIPQLKKIKPGLDGVFALKKEGENWSYASTLPVVEPMGTYQNQMAHFNVAQEISQLSIRMAKMEVDAYISWQKATKGPDEHWKRFVSDWRYDEKETAELSQAMQRGKRQSVSSGKNK